MWKLEDVNILGAIPENSIFSRSDVRKAFRCVASNFVSSGKIFLKLLRSKDSYLRYERDLDFGVIQNGFHLETTLYETMRKRGKLVP
jgi:transketolase C-terminal domain/subunit